MVALKIVLVMGLNRSGTTWLCNTLIEYFRLFAPNHFLHYGYKESHIGKQQLYWNDLSTPEAFSQFRHFFEETDLFKLSAVHQQYRDSPNDFRDFTAYFFDLMATAVECVNANGWLTKLDLTLFDDGALISRLDEELSRSEGDIKFLLIERRMPELLSSLLTKPGPLYQKRNDPLRRMLAVITGASRYVVFNRKMKAYVRRHQGLLINYADLKENFETVLTRIAAYIDEPIHHQKPQTSVSNSSNKANLLWAEKWMIRFSVIFEILPWLSWAVTKLRRVRRRPIFYRRLQWYENDKTRLRQHLAEDGHVQLLRIIDDQIKRSPT